MANAGSHPYVRALFACLAALLAAAVLPAASFAADPSRQDRVERSIIRKVNRLRSSSGLGRLRASRALARAADSHSADMVQADYFGHPSSNGQDVSTRVQAFRRSTWVGETLAFIPPTAAEQQAQLIVDIWMASQAHHDSLMDGRFSRMGVGRRSGLVGGRPTTVFTADLASSR